MICTAISKTVDLVENGHWNYASCVRCDSRLHGRLGKALSAQALDTFVKIHAHPSAARSRAVAELTAEVARSR